MKACRGGRSIAPFIYNLGIIWRLVVKFTFRPLYPRDKTHDTHSIGSWVGFRGGLDVVEMRRIYFVCRLSKPGNSSWLPSHYTDYAVSIFFQYYKRRYEITPPIFLSETIITIVIKFTYIIGTVFINLRLFFHKFSFIINTLFPPLQETLYAGRVKLFAEASKLFAHALSARRLPQNGLILVHPSGGQKDGRRRVLKKGL
jgi:hypothetical protein